MLIGHFTEQPWQDESSGLMGTQSTDLGISNSHYQARYRRPVVQPLPRREGLCRGDGL